MFKCIQIIMNIMKRDIELVIRVTRQGPHTDNNAHDQDMPLMSIREINPSAECAFHTHLKMLIWSRMQEFGYTHGDTLIWYKKWVGETL